jgi:hypothetical protein
MSKTHYHSHLAIAEASGHENGVSGNYTPPSASDGQFPQTPLTTTIPTAGPAEPQIRFGRFAAKCICVGRVLVPMTPNAAVHAYQLDLENQAIVSHFVPACPREGVQVIVCRIPFVGDMSRKDAGLSIQHTFHTHSLCVLSDLDGA